MYTVFMMLLIGLGLLLAVNGAMRRRVGQTAVGVIVTVGTVFFFWFMGFLGEMLWFDGLGYSDRFWQVFLVQLFAGAAGAVCLAGCIFLLTLGYSPKKMLARWGGILLAGAIGLSWGIANWETILRFLYAAPTEMQDPIFGRTVGFYLFTLPLLDSVDNLLFWLALIGLAAVAADVYLIFGGIEPVSLRLPQDSSEAGRAYRAVGLLLLVMAFGMYLKRFHLMYSEFGAVNGPGWTDVHIRLPALTIMVTITVLMAIALFIPGLRGLVQRWPWLRNRQDNGHSVHAYVMGSALISIIVLQALLTSVLPSLFQWLRVEPNEITFEEPYIAHNIEFTRNGFRLQNVEEREYPAGNRFTREIVQQNPAIFSNIRLWDWRALDAVYKQFQEIRLYYEFKDVDVDRYTVGGDYRQVMVSAREMDLENLPDQSQTFVNRRFKYTHGYGITMANVSDFTPQGLPILLIRDIPPRSRYDELNIKQPGIYYGELTKTPVFVNTREEEFDYPQGEENAYIRYSGSGGVVMKNLWRKFLFGWKFDGMRLLLSGYLTPESRFMFHRQIRERAETLAPFLVFDDDAYIVLADGRLYWIMDAYTTSAFYPYSEPFTAESAIDTLRGGEAAPTNTTLGRFRGSNYVRNSVKAVVDAFNGSVDFYVFDEKDPLIRTWQRVFPDMFKSKEGMPPALRSHVRYPIDMLLLQGLVYAKYHMTDPTVFYNQEDLWVRATEKYYSNVQPVEPYYIIWELPKSDHPEFVLMLPFTPKNRQVSIGWIAGMCDGDNYGRFLAYKFPKDKRILGPQQVETKIDQDRFLSGQLTLWDQRGSRVIRGNVLAIPVDQSVLYVEPIYLQAETAAYPELRLVALMHGDLLSYAESFEKALQGLFEDVVPSQKQKDRARTVADLIQSANKAFGDYLSAMGEKHYSEASRALERLESYLKSLQQGTGGQPVTEPDIEAAPDR